jgi:hypothetical protein
MSHGTPSRKVPSSPVKAGPSRRRSFFVFSGSEAQIFFPTSRIIKFSAASSTEAASEKDPAEVFGHQGIQGKGVS